MKCNRYIFKGLPEIPEHQSVLRFTSFSSVQPGIRQLRAGIDKIDMPLLVLALREGCGTRLNDPIQFSDLPDYPARTDSRFFA